MNKKDEKLLEKNGWIVECKSPFEIRHEETGSFATLWAADYVLEMLKQENSKLYLLRKVNCGTSADKTDILGVTYDKEHAKSQESVFCKIEKVKFLR